jgi:DNA mismatch repair ATPase MutS
MVSTVIQRCTFNLRPNLHRTGLELARLADLPANVTIEAKRVSLLLMKREKERKLTSASSQVAIRRKTLLTVGHYAIPILTN